MNYAIIAAGEGSRLVGEGVALPKPLIPIEGEGREPMIERLINIFMRNNAESITVIVNEFMTEVREHLEALGERNPLLTLVVKTTPSSMHSLWELSKVMPAGKFCLTTVDTIFREEDFAGYVSAFEDDDEHDGLWAVTPFIDDEKPLYVDVDDAMNVTAFRDSDDGDARFVSGGIYAINSEKAFPVLNECIAAGKARMRNFQRALIDAGCRLKAYSFPKIVDVDHAADIDTARRFLSHQD